MVNAFWERAHKARRLTSLFAVLKRELADEKKRKLAEIKKFEALEGDVAALRKFETDSGMTRDICERILNEVGKDLETCQSLLNGDDGDNGVDGEKSLSALYSTPNGSAWKPGKKKGHKPVDLIVTRPKACLVLLGDCKFGLKGEDPWLVRDVDDFEKGFHGKIKAVAKLIKDQDRVDASDEMLLIATSDLAPLLRNRMSDFQQDEHCKAIPYDRLHVCSVSDTIAQARKFLCWDSAEGETPG